MLFPAWDLWLSCAPATTQMCHPAWLDGGNLTWRSPFGDVRRHPCSAKSPVFVFASRYRTVAGMVAVVVAVIVLQALEGSDVLPRRKATVSKGVKACEPG